VLLNLLSNAIKFTQDGSVSCAVASSRAGGVRITVADTGIGIKEEHLEKIFEDFRQLDQSHTREYGGTGLGLSITRKLLSLLGGRPRQPGRSARSVARCPTGFVAATSPANGAAARSG
jgi:signal transduction histidine kinase